jgi:hypothetical protein
MFLVMMKVLPSEGNGEVIQLFVTTLIFSACLKLNQSFNPTVT